MIDECLAIGIKVQAILTADARPVQNVTEWAKKEAAGTASKRSSTRSPRASRRAQRAVSAVAERKRDAAATQKIDTGIAAQVKVLSMQPRSGSLSREFLRRIDCSPHRRGILDLVTGRNPGVPSEAQAKRLLALRQRAADSGILVVTWRMPDGQCV